MNGGNERTELDVRRAMSEWEQESGVKERTSKEWKGGGLYLTRGVIIAGRKF